jgi:hypothetical protein
VCTPQSAVAGVASEWNFRNSDLAASYGSLSMGYWNGTTTSNAVSFADASVGGVTKKVMQFGVFNNTQGFSVNASSLTSYTMIWDVMIPTTTNNYCTLLQTDATNGVDGTLCTKKSGNTFSVGVNAYYGGAAAFDAWHRIAVTVAGDTVDNTSTINYYIDGTNVVSNAAYVGTVNKFPVGSSGFLLFADNDSDFSAASLSAFYITDGVKSAAEIAALGGASAAGIGSAVPEPSTIVVLLTGMISLLAYAWRRRK